MGESSGGRERGPAEPCCMSVDLILTGGGEARWADGITEDGRGGVRSCAEAVRRAVDEGESGWVLFWDTRLGRAPEELVKELLERPGDVWHGGLGVGLRGKPELFDFVTPCWMLHGDPEEGIEASSWRVSLRCCLIRRELLRVVGGLDLEYESMEAAGLDLGYRCLCAGAMMRFVPGLAGSGDLRPVSLPLRDEARLVKKARGRKWLVYGLARAAMTGHCGVREAWRAYWGARDAAGVQLGGWAMRHPGMGGRGDSPLCPQRNGLDGCGDLVRGHRGVSQSRVTVLVPTVDRYPYLRVLMGQLARQTVAPNEVIVVDQTEPGRRERSWQEEAAGLRLRVIELDEAGQCSSRNAGLKASTGDWVLFLDDDDEVPADLVERFLRSARETGAEVVCGVAEEENAPAPGPWFGIRRMSDVFPTNAGMVRRKVFERSGLFDLAYERGARADGDLGTRMYRSGAWAVLDPGLRVFHHHAPRGGLRKHKARVATFAASRERVWVRQLPEVTELYLKMRFYTPRQVRESLVMSVLGTFSVKGRWWKRAAKVLAGLVLLPDTLWELRKRLRAARAMLERYPRIERLEG